MFLVSRLAVETGQLGQPLRMLVSIQTALNLENLSEVVSTTLITSGSTVVGTVVIEWKVRSDAIEIIATNRPIQRCFSAPAGLRGGI